jgi:hypothetical protein
LTNLPSKVAKALSSEVVVMPPSCSRDGKKHKKGKKRKKKGSAFCCVVRSGLYVQTGEFVELRSKQEEGGPGPVGQVVKFNHRPSGDTTVVLRRCFTGEQLGLEQSTDHPEYVVSLHN